MEKQNRIKIQKDANVWILDGDIVKDSDNDKLEWIDKLYVNNS